MPNEAIIQAEAAAHTIKFTSRDWKLLHGPFVEHGNALLRLLGFSGSQSITVHRAELLQVSEEVMSVLARDFELLQYDYTYHFSGTDKNRKTGGSGGFCGFKIKGEYWCIFAEPGHCYLCQTVRSADGQARGGNFVDLRNCQPVQTDDWGVITIRRRKKGVSWISELPGLIEFLRQIPDLQVEVQNQHR